LFRDDPEAITRGRYYFAPPSTPHAPIHNVGSGTWHDQNWRKIVTLGEIPESERTYYVGDPPEAIPLAQAVGSQFCRQEGELIGLAANPSDLINGYPAGCYSLDEGMLFFRTSQYDRCSLQRFWAWVINLQYLGETAAIDSIMQDMFEDGYVITHHDEAGALPNLVIGVNPACAFVSINGTNNYQQLSLQAFDLFRAPRNYGILACAEVVYTSSTWVIERLADAGVDETKPLFLAGHSYGGAIALVTAARLHHGIPSRKIRYMTFGSPKPGNAALADILRGLGGINLVNDQDWVSVLPPDIPLSFPVSVILSNPFLTYRAWDKPGAQVLLGEDGTLTPDANPLMDTATLLPMVERALASLPQLPILAHGVDVYYDRTTRRCPDVEWPINQDVDEDMPQGFFSNTCETSIPLVIAEPFEASIREDDQHWFVFAQAAGQGLSMIVTGGGGGTNFGIDVFWGDCSGLFLVQQRVPPGTFAFITPGSNTTVHLQLATLLDVDYSIEIVAS